MVVEVKPCSTVVSPWLLGTGHPWAFSSLKILITDTSDPHSIAIRIYNPPPSPFPLPFCQLLLCTCKRKRTRTI